MQIPCHTRLPSVKELQWCVKVSVAHDIYWEEMNRMPGDRIMDTWPPAQKAWKRYMILWHQNAHYNSQLTQWMTPNLEARSRSIADKYRAKKSGTI